MTNPVNIQATNKRSHQEKLEHPRYSPDLTPSDYQLLLHLHMKKYLGDQGHDNDDDFKVFCSS